MLTLYANAIVIDQYGDVLLMKHTAESTHRPPGSPVALNELAPDTAVTAVRHHTGLIAMPVRLAGLTWWSAKAGPLLFLNFRCILRGGDLTTPDAVQAGFFKVRDLPAPTNRLFDQMLNATVSHKGGAPFEATYEPALLERLRGPWPDAPTGAPNWQTHTCLIIRNPSGEILWQRDGDAWRLPEAPTTAEAAPWSTTVAPTAVGANPTLTGIYTTPNTLTLTFSATTSDAPSATTAYFAPGSEPDGALPHHVARVADATAPGSTVAFRRENPAALTETG